jgi:beta-glucanase (GH16 family)
MDKGLNRRDVSDKGDSTYVGVGDTAAYNLNQHLTWRNPFLIAFLIIFVAAGVYLLAFSSADTIAASKVWNSAADWDNANLSDAAVSANSVGLAQAVAPISTTSTSTVNLALNRPAYASSTNRGNNFNHTSQIRLQPRNVDDGSLATRWGSDYSDPQWIYINLGKTYSISEVKLSWETAYAKSYDIQVSNNAKQWTTVYSTTTNKGDVNDITGLKASGKYIRMYGISRGTQWGYSLWEMGVYGPPSSSTNTTAPTTNYDKSGTATVSFDAGRSATWTSLAGETTLPTGTAISYEARTSTDDSTWSSWSSVPTNGNLSTLQSSRYIQVEANLSTTATASTPLLNQLTLNYSVDIASPTVSLTSTSATLTAGSSTTISWTSTNATSCSASGAWSASEPTSGSLSVSPSTTSTYDLSCTGAGGTSSATPPLTITVSPAVTTGGGGTTTTTTSSGCSSSGTVAPCIGSSTTGASGWGTPIFDDEFTGTSLDTSDWSTGWFGSGISGPVNSLEQDCYDPAQVAVANGELDLNLIQKTETCTGSARPYTTGLITTDGKFSYTYGFAEARIWVPGSSTITDWPSFWQDGQSWPTDGELDVLEGLGGQACGHWHGPSSGSGLGWNLGSGCSSATYTGGWHTFAANWSASGITWYYDGQDMGSITAAQASANSNSLVGEPQYLILGLGVSSDHIQAPASQRVDYVRVWQQK